MLNKTQASAKAKTKSNKTKSVWIVFPESSGWNYMSLNEWVENRRKTDGDEIEFVYPS